MTDNRQLLEMQKQLFSNLLREVAAIDDDGDHLLAKREMLRHSLAVYGQNYNGKGDPYQQIGADITAIDKYADLARRWKENNPVTKHSEPITPQMLSEAAAACNEAYGRIDDILAVEPERISALLQQSRHLADDYDRRMQEEKTAGGNDGDENDAARHAAEPPAENIKALQKELRAIQAQLYSYQITGGYPTTQDIAGQLQTMPPPRQPEERGQTP